MRAMKEKKFVKDSLKDLKGMCDVRENKNNLFKLQVSNCSILYCTKADACEYAIQCFHNKIGINQAIFIKFPGYIYNAKI